MGEETGLPAGRNGNQGNASRGGAVGRERPGKKNRALQSEGDRQGPGNFEYKVRAGLCGGRHHAHHMTPEIFIERLEARAETCTVWAEL